MPTQKSKLPSVQIRMAAGQMLLRGESIATVCEEVGISVKTANRYQELFAAGGLAALENMSVGGRPSALSPEAFNWIAAALQGEPQAYGFPGARWTSGTLGQLIERQFGVKYSRVYVRQIVLNLGLGPRLGRRLRE
ncbi:transposase [Burkholderia sp. PAMC 28687]|uniref:helix-turn-helix domain-containing protein n=1 Tax=Burkholderiaceae TaxID=119060 RepID=UPI00076B3BE6|nr:MULTISPECIES: helix-turn-helix domain-containing protein [Burkholderiaceae]AME22965.1 transposase [Burkholderia sp. PAMC 26561]AMM14832.1 transposase [Burkholderia sp. PAMC 28687]